MAIMYASQLTCFGMHNLTSNNCLRAEQTSSEKVGPALQGNFCLLCYHLHVVSSFQELCIMFLSAHACLLIPDRLDSAVVASCKGLCINLAHEQCHQASFEAWTTGS